MAQDMKVHLYDVKRHDSGPIDNLFQAILSDPIESRMRTVGTTEIRLEECIPPHTGDNSTGFWLLDFIKMRVSHGPGKASRNGPISGFDIGKNGGFGEETAALYDPQKKVILLQYNHNGPRATSICSYLNSYNPNTTEDYDMWIRMKAAATAKLNKTSIITKIHAKISPGDITSDLRNAGVGLNEAIKFSQYFDGHDIEIRITAGRKRKSQLNFQKTRDFVSSLQHLFGQNGAVEALEVTGKTAPESRPEPIDLMEDKLEEKITGLELGEDLRYTQKSRWLALIKARKGWDSIL